MMKTVLALAAAVCFGLPASAVADHHEGGAPAMPDMDAMMEAWTKAAAVGEQHQMLAGMVGEWKTTTTHYEMGQETDKSEGKATFKSMLGGRVIQGRHSGLMMGQPFEGVGLDGYDNVTGKYWSVWMDSMSTGVYVMKGEQTGDHEMTYTGTMTMPMMGDADMRMVITHDTKDHMVMKMWMKMPGMEEETESMVMEYQRVSS